MTVTAAVSISWFYSSTSRRHLLSISPRFPLSSPVYHFTDQLSVSYVLQNRRNLLKITAAMTQEVAQAEAMAQLQNTKLYFGNLPYNCDSEQLAGVIQEHASPEMIEVLYDKETGRSRGFAVVTMSSIQDCEAVISNLNGFLGSVACWQPLVMNLLAISMAVFRVMDVAYLLSIYSLLWIVRLGVLVVDGNLCQLLSPLTSLPSLISEQYDGRKLRVKFSDKSKPPRVPLYVESEFKLFVGNLCWSVTSEALKQVFKDYGNLLSARVIYDGETGRSRGFGFVCFSTKEELDSAMESLNGVELEGRALRISLALGKKA